MLGLKPVAGGPYRQAVKLLECPHAGGVVHPGCWALRAGGGRAPSNLGGIGCSGAGQWPASQPNIRSRALVFAGYGVTAPEERWDDFKV